MSEQVSAGFDKIREYFKCYVHMGYSDDSLLCPRCSKILCTNCMEEHRMARKRACGSMSCPYCDLPVTRAQFTKLRWFPDFLKDLKELEQYAVEKLEREERNKKLSFAEHAKKLKLPTKQPKPITDFYEPVSNKEWMAAIDIQKNGDRDIGPLNDPILISDESQPVDQPPEPEQKNSQTKKKLILPENNNNMPGTSGQNKKKFSLKFFAKKKNKKNSGEIVEAAAAIWTDSEQEVHSNDLFQPTDEVIAEKGQQSSSDEEERQHGRSLTATVTKTTGKRSKETMERTMQTRQSSRKIKCPPKSKKTDSFMK